MLVMDDPTAMRWAAGSIEVEAHCLQHLDHRHRQVGGPKHVAAEIQEHLLGFERCRRAINERLFARHELEVNESIDFAEVFREREVFHRWAYRNADLAPGSGPALYAL